MSSMTDDKLESNYKGNALLHLLSYMKPYAGWVMLCLVLVLALTGFDLYRPTLIGDAIDNFETQGDYNVIINTAWKYGCACSKLYFQYGTDLDFAEDWTKDHSDCKTRAVYSYSKLKQSFL